LKKTERLSPFFKWTPPGLKKDGGKVKKKEKQKTKKNLKFLGGRRF
jgi:hypothetical protein